MQSKRQTGQSGEAIAATWLEAQGYHICDRNFHCRTGEIDLVAREQGILCFIEVKYRRGNRFGGAAEAVNHRKRERLIKAAYYYLNGRDLPCRFDVVAIDETLHGQQITLIRNAFDAS